MEDWLLQIDEPKRGKVRIEYENAKSLDKKIELLYSHHPKGHLSPLPVKHLDDYLKCIRLTTTDSSWFRGQSKEYSNLIPKIYRNIQESDVDHILVKERKYFLEFKRRAKSLVNPFPDHDDWSWYFLIQHYGGPTRLLDWTSNAAVALFMALDTDRDSLENPIVYTLSPTVLSDYAYKDLGKENDKKGSVLYPGEDVTNNWISNLNNGNDGIPDSPIALLPAYSDTRIIAQKSCFTLFGKRVNGFVKDNNEILCPCCEKKIIHRIIIDGSKKESLRKELSKIGVTSETVYPGLEGLNKDIFQEIFC